VKPLPHPRCSGCGKPFDGCASENHYCSTCLKNNWNFSRASAFFLYVEPITRLIHSLKYKGETSSLPTLSNLARKHFHLPQCNGTEIIIPVPLHAKRLRERGFNQSLLLARSLFPNEKKIINTSILQRHRWTEPQTVYDGKARRKNLRNAFSVRTPGPIKGKKILLIDDVFTTGTTVNECAGVLLKAGAAEVIVFTLARVDG
jgi:ComF family protein